MATSTTAAVTPNETSVIDQSEYQEFQQFKQFQALFNNTTNKEALTGYVNGNGVNGNGTRVGPLSRRDSTVEEFHGFLSQQFPKIGNPAPLGLCAFALTTFILSMYNVGAFVPSFGANGVVLGMAMFYGGLIQLLAGLVEIKTGNSFGALAFASYGGFWLSFSAIRVESFNFLSDYSGDNADQLNNALGVYLMAWTIFTFAMCIASHRTSVALFLLFFFLTLTFLLLCIAQFTLSVATHQAGGAFGILTAAIAFYAAFAAILDRRTQNSLFTLPVGDLRLMFPTAEERQAMALKQV